MAQPNSTLCLPKARLDELLRLLHDDQYEVIGPRIDQGAICYGPLQSASELPTGWTDRQGPGTYRLERRSDAASFGYAVGPHSWKKYLFPASLCLWRGHQTPEGLQIEAERHDPPRRAFLGVRSCELHALAIQDRVFLNREGQYTDPYYAAARSRLLLIAVECEHPAETCFCDSMGTGPAVETDAIPGPLHHEAGETTKRTTLPLVAPLSPPSDLAVCDLILNELADVYVVRATSPAGQEILNRLNLAEASDAEVEEARNRIDSAARQMQERPTRKVDRSDLKELLHRNQEHPQWNDLAERCLSCTNCTLVCPTCFCSSTEDVSDLHLDTAARVRVWDSCFNPEFARVHGGDFRPTTRGRYRQWLTHKFASWIDQFGVSGCVGCGRCISWCPVGIDVTQELAVIRSTDGQTVGRQA